MTLAVGRRCCLYMYLVDPKRVDEFLWVDHVAHALADLLPVSRPPPEINYIAKTQPTTTTNGNGNGSGDVLVMMVMLMLMKMMVTKMMTKMIMRK
jgi:hypothetical protein